VVFRVSWSFVYEGYIRVDTAALWCTFFMITSLTIYFLFLSWLYFFVSFYISTFSPAVSLLAILTQLVIFRKHRIIRISLCSSQFSSIPHENED
jgi:hypothetical protein